MKKNGKEHVIALSEQEVREQHQQFGTDENFLRQVFDSLEDYAIFTTDVKGFVTSWNKGSHNLLGYSEEEIIGRDANIFYTEKDRRAGIPELELEQAANNGRAINERFHVRKDGSSFWGSGLAFPLLNNSKELLGFTKVMRDLTDRMAAQQALADSEEYFKSIVETVREPLIVLNRDFTVSTANRSFYQVFQVDSSEVLGRYIYDIDNGKWNNQILKEMLSLALEGNNTCKDFEIGYESPSTGKRVLLLNARKLFGIGTGYEMLLLAMEDITDRKLLEQQRNDFIGIVSHELKTPVTSLKAFGEVLQLKLAEDSGAVAMLQKMDSQINKLTVLINDLLDATRIEGGKLQFQEELFSIDEILNEIIEEVQRTTRKHHIEKNGNTDVTIAGDKYRIGQVITNLLTNAIKYSPGADRVVVECLPRNDHVVCCIRDFGIGIPKDQHERVFERFFRVPGDKLHTFPGMGLGLYISAEIIKRQGGEIWMDSEPGKGSVFCFSVPISNK